MANVTPPSKEDLLWLTNENVDEIGVIASNGDVFIVRRGDGDIISAREFLEISSQIDAEVNLELMNDPDFINWTIQERNYMGIREQFFRIARYFKWHIAGGRL